MNDAATLAPRAARYELATIEVLWRRDLLRFFRQPSRIAGALGQPVIFWLVLGTGFGASFRVPGIDVDYMTFFFPGVVTMVLLFASIFAAVSVIDDRHQGFLQAVLAGPGSRSALVMGKCLGATTVAVAQSLLFVALAPLAGFSYGTIDWLLLLSTMTLASLGLTALGFLVAWLVDNVQGYHALQMIVLVPLWVISGAMFPPNDGVYRWMMLGNPVAHAVSAIRHALHGELPSALALTGQPSIELGVVAVFAGLSLWSAMLVCEKRR